MEDRIERINLLIKYLGLTKNSLALNSGLAPSNLNKMLLGEQSITDKTLYKICEAYPQINIDWLKTGEGEMIIKNPSMSQNGDGGSRQQGTAGHNLTQTNNSEKILKEFIEGLKSQNSLTEKAMEQSDRTLKNLEKALTNVEKAMEGTNKATEVTHQALSEMSEQRKLMDRLIAIIEKDK